MKPNAGVQNKYFLINVGVTKEWKLFIKDIGPWLRRGQHGLSPTPLQCERTQDAAWFRNTYVTMEMEPF